MIKYPYYREFNTENDIKHDFKQLKNYKLNLIDIKHARKITNNYKFEKCEGKYVIILDDYYKNFKMNHITDYFSEICRVYCKKYNKKLSPINEFELIKKKFATKYKNRKIFREKVSEHLWKNNIMCQLFKVTVIKQLYLYFNADNILDFSSGWGDRLIAACSLNKKYFGVDPSNCMEKYYKEIINTLPDDKKKYKVIKEPFEKVNLKKKYDFIFSSPPFFNLEEYEDDSKQSNIKYKTLDKWKNNFLFKVIEKCNTCLNKNKYFCIHISDYNKFNYVNDMLKFIKEKTNLKYIGKFYYIYTYYENNVRTYSKPLFIRIFKKI